MPLSNIVMSTQVFHSLAELRTVIESHQAWGMSLDEFKRKFGTREEGGITYATRFEWGSTASTLQDMWEIVQYIHRFYGSVEN
ncbi:hypothetical protein [Deinococcus aquiradiocola]|uniref:Uncharacterized protein n=1 Tax=Deinococcus aquiradiocola TaxID=393059 RepID=A0A917P7L4_9DEIO|nr:hypothetical protein [Deinococcus aquiradiocola]GGJ65230.1 hypothetical protein GCM10008939_06430 [Deinococcus aquiradiocola]